MTDAPRKIVHIDMDAFYASVEQRDNPALAGKPVIVAWRGARSVVCAASYEVRRFGVHSAMSAVRAERLCPHAIFVPPDFSRYKAVSRQIHEIFARHTDLIEPLSLDEAYLDVTVPKIDLPTATETAQAIRAAIHRETGLTASAGVASNKYIAKIASDWHKPDGIMVVPPQRVASFLAPLPVRKLPGVGKVTNRKLADLGVTTVGELKSIPLAQLEQCFGRIGRRLYERARGIDDTPVKNHRETVQVSAETTFEHDLPLDQLESRIRELSDRTWAAAARKQHKVARTVVLKLKTADFKVMTRSITPPIPPDSADQLGEVACALRTRFGRPADCLYRLVGVGLSGFAERKVTVSQEDLFEFPSSQPSP